MKHKKTLYHCVVEAELNLMSHQTYYRSYRPLSGTGFCGSKDPTNSVKGLKEDTVLRIRLQSHQAEPTASGGEKHRDDRISCGTKSAACHNVTQSCEPGRHADTRTTAPAFNVS